MREEGQVIYEANEVELSYMFYLSCVLRPACLTYLHPTLESMRDTHDLQSRLSVTTKNLSVNSFVGLKKTMKVGKKHVTV